MAKIDALWDVFKAAKVDAEAYFKTCGFFCNSLADTIWKELVGNPVQYNVVHDRPNKQTILTMSFPVPPDSAAQVLFIVTKKDNEFLIAIRKSDKQPMDEITDKFVVPETGPTKEQLTDIVNTTYRWLEARAISAAWQVP